MTAKTKNVIVRVEHELKEKDKIDDSFDAIMQNGLDEAKSDHSRPAPEVFADLKRRL